ncbi:hypothetical protein BCR39DRAFT_41930 [Naematelia encephala]|uniref:Uncharacterized protein n=1 Tax=Naematelia encephala TaxID=71784 RepID=A0A1Y2BBM5_9TREE|nr:hypothetical protein BCR39DRAFT_41930 [Naematelia encephala]
MSSWVGKWAFAVHEHDTPVGYRKPIPFDHIFSSLDSKISFDPNETLRFGSTSASHITSSEMDKELQHDPDHAISHAKVSKVVVPHHPLRPWEDIPPYQRARGYNDQPAYTDDYDDFLWLPRDPLSTLDLDDTVEMRLALTTSAGGSGRLGDWPHSADDASDSSKHDDKEWQAVEIRREMMTPDSQAADASPLANSERRLLEHLELPSNIGSEVDQGTGSGLMRRGTRKATQGLTALFRRPRSNSDRSEGGGISMRTLSISSHPVREQEAPPSPTPGPSTGRPLFPSVHISDGSVFLSPTRGSTPRPGITLDSDQPGIDNSSRPLRTGSSFSARLSRSPSRRQPTARRATITYDESSGIPQRTPSGSRYAYGVDRSMSIVSPQRSRDVARSISVLSAHEQALMKEVMAEERIASRSGEKAVQDDLRREEEEVSRERMKRQQQPDEVEMRRTSVVQSDEVVRRPDLDREESGGTMRIRRVSANGSAE